MDDTAIRTVRELETGSLRRRMPRHAVRFETTRWKTAKQQRNKYAASGVEKPSGREEEEIEVEYGEGESAADGEVDVAVKDELDELLGLQVQFGESQALPLDSPEVLRVKQDKDVDGCLHRRTGRQPVQQVNIGGEAFKMWSDVGLSQGLHTDPEIATFLLQHYESTKNIVFPGNQCTVCHQPLSLFCSQCNRPVASQPASIMTKPPASVKKMKKTTQVLREPSKRACKKHQQILDCSSKRKIKKRKTAEKKEDAALAGLNLVTNIDEDDTVDNYDDEHFSNKADEDLNFIEDTSTDNQPKQMPKLLLNMKEKETIKFIHKSTKAVTVGVEEKVFNCKVCSHSYTRACTLKAHMRKHTGEKPFKCAQCDAAFSLSGSLIVHRRTHTGDKPYVCEDCGRSFSISSALKQHRRQHTGEKPYECSICLSKYSRSDSLKVHMRSHSGDRPFICEECGADFSRLYCLIAHKKKHSGERPFQCMECEATFTQSGKLTIHMRKHTGDRPFQCEQCGASFTQSDRLKTHMRIHSGEKPYKCGECGKGFSHPHSLKVHGRAHTGDRPYKCEICSLTFADPSYFRRHKSKHAAAAVAPGVAAAAPDSLAGGFSAPVSSDAEFSAPASAIDSFSVPLSPAVDISVSNPSTVLSPAFNGAHSVMTSVNQDCFSVSSAGFSITNTSSVPSMGFSIPSSSALGFSMPASSAINVVTDDADVTCNINPTDPFSFLRSALHCTGSYPS